MTRFHSLIAALAIVSAGLSEFNQSHAALLFSDDFDSDTVGTLATGWSVVAAGAGTQFVVTNVPFASSSPNVFLHNNPNNAGFETARFFSGVNLSNMVASGLEKLQVRYSLSVGAIPDGATTGNAGFTIALGQGTPGGFSGGFSGASLRVFSDAGTTNSWRLYEPANGVILTNNLQLDSFFDVFVEITPNPGKPNTGTVAYEFNGNPVGSFAYNSPSLDINGLRIDPANGTGTNVPVAFSFDDVSVAAVPEPSAAVSILLGLGALGILRRRYARSEPFDPIHGPAV